MFLPYKITSYSISCLPEIKTLSDDYARDYQESNEMIKEKSTKIVQQQTIDGTELQELWFPVDELGKFDVFISHSHRDMNKLVVPFASWLFSHLGLRCFIDSQFWQYADDLLNILDSEYAWQPGNRTYNYKIRNFTTSNIHIMLSMALMKIINKTETVIFIDSDNSVKYKKDDREVTPSPWIYEEVNFAKSLESKIPVRWLKYFSPELEKEVLYEERKFSDSRQPNFYYKINTSDFYQLNSGFLNGLILKGIRGEDAMDEMHWRNISRFRNEKRQIHG